MWRRGRGDGCGEGQRVPVKKDEQKRGVLMSSGTTTRAVSQDGRSCCQCWLEREGGGRNLRRAPCRCHTCSLRETTPG